MTCKNCQAMQKMVELQKEKIRALEKRLTRALETIKRHTDTAV